MLFPPCDRSNLSQEESILAYNWRIHSIMVGRAGQWECEAAGHTAHSQEAERGMLLLSSLSSFHGIWELSHWKEPSHIWVCFPSSVGPLWKHLIDMLKGGCKPCHIDSED